MVVVTVVAVGLVFDRIHDDNVRRPDVFGLERQLLDVVVVFRRPSEERVVPEEHQLDIGLQGLVNHRKPQHDAILILRRDRVVTWLFELRLTTWSTKRPAQTYLRTRKLD